MIAHVDNIIKNIADVENALFAFRSHVDSKLEEVISKIGSTIALENTDRHPPKATHDRLA